MRRNEKITALYERLSRDDFGKDDDQQDEQGLPHGLVLAVPVFFALFFAHHVKKAQHGHTEGHDAGQIEHEDGIHTIS